MPLDLPSNSRFKLSTPVISADGVETYALMTKFDFMNTSEYIDYRVNSITAHRPDLIAEEVYGSTSLYWVVIMYNKPRSPFRWPNNQDIIRLPKSSIVWPDL